MSVQDLKTLEWVVERVDIDEDFMYPIKPTMGVLVDGTSALLAMAGWLDDVLCAIAIPVFGGLSVGKPPMLCCMPEGETVWSPNTTSMAASMANDVIFRIGPVLTALHLGYLTIPDRYFMDMRRGSQNETS